MRTGLILAGGDSSRFGSPKALAPFRGRPMVRWVADAMAAVTDELLVSLRSRDQAALFRRILPEAQVVLDVRRGRGPIEGFVRGFEAAHGDFVLVAPCDAPLLRPALYVYRTDAARFALSESEPRCPSALVDVLGPVILDAPELRRADPSLASFVDVNHRADLDRVARTTRGPGRGVKTPAGASLHTVGT